MTNENTFNSQIAPVTVGAAWTNLLRNPSRIVTNWNYKNAIMSGLLRAPIFLITYLAGRESLKLAIGAATAQFAFRFLFAGVGGALIQSFRRVEPAWKALVTILLIVPIISHIIEFLVQTLFAYATKTLDHTDEAIVRSMCVSVISALFSLFIMRRGVMIVGEDESKSFFNDIINLPVMMFHFCAFIPLEIAQMIRRKNFGAAFLSFLGFAAFSQLICFGVTQKLYWTYNSGRTIPILNIWAVDGTILMLLAVVAALIFLSRKPQTVN